MIITEQPYSRRISLSFPLTFTVVFRRAAPPFLQPLPYTMIFATVPSSYLIPFHGTQTPVAPTVPFPSCNETKQSVVVGSREPARVFGAGVGRIRLKRRVANTKATIVFCFTFSWGLLLCFPSPVYNARRGINSGGIASVNFRNCMKLYEILHWSRSIFNLTVILELLPQTVAPISRSLDLNMLTKIF